MFTLLYNMTIGIQGRQRGIYLNFTVHYYTSQQLISLHSFFWFSTLIRNILVLLQDLNLLILL